MTSVKLVCAVMVAVVESVPVRVIVDVPLGGSEMVDEDTLLPHADNANAIEPSSRTHANPRSFFEYRPRNAAARIPARAAPNGNGLGALFREDFAAEPNRCIACAPV